MRIWKISTGRKNSKLKFMEVKKMEKETLFERIVIWVLKKLRFIETREVSKYEMCKCAQSVCSHNCNSCAWNENK